MCGYQGHRSQRPACLDLPLPDSTTTEHVMSSLLSRPLSSCSIFPESSLPPPPSSASYFSRPQLICSFLSVALPWQPGITDESLPEHTGHALSENSPLSVFPPAWELLAGTEHILFIFISQYVFGLWCLVGHQRMFIRTKCSEFLTLICLDGIWVSLTLGLHCCTLVKSLERAMKSEISAGSDDLSTQAKHRSEQQGDANC